MEFQVKNRFSGEVQFTAEIDCDEGAPLGVKLGLAVKWAVKAGAYLVRANLAGANLADANLAGADLADANLAGANLVRADLAGANLADAYLVRANLADANLAGANLVRADLARANLADAYLVRANLAGANLAGADLARANLTGANLADANLAGAKWGKRCCTKPPIQINGLFKSYIVTILDDAMQIGCELHGLDEWRGFDDRRLVQMDGKEAAAAWRANKAALFAIAEAQGRWSPPADSDAA